MHELRRRLLLDLIRVADLCVMTAAFFVAAVVAGHSMQNEGLTEFFAVRIKLVNFVFFVGWTVFWHLLLKSFGLYRSRRAGVLASEWWAVTKAATVGTLVLSFVAVLFELTVVSSMFLVFFWCTTLFGTITVRLFLRALFSETRRSGSSLRRLAIVGCGPRGAEFGKRVRQRPDLGYLLLGYIDDLPAPENPLHGGSEKILGTLDQLRGTLEQHEVEEVVITLPIASHYRTISNVIQVCEELAVDVLMPSDFFKTRLVNVTVDDSRAWPAMELRNCMPSVGAVFLKRSLDLVVSLVALVVLSPILLVIALAIKLDSRGPVFFRQDRMGWKRRLFKMHKFRTMHVDAEQRIGELEEFNEVNGAAFKMTDDPRVTRIGRTLRRLSLDELPQFIDVLLGNMSLVGPRPLPLRDIERFDRSWQKRRFSVKPGLTCLWQVNGRHELDFEQWMELDLEYVDNWSLSMDFDILLKTLPAVVRGDGAS